MRIDKLLSVTGRATRSEASRAARDGRITVNGIAERSAARNIDPDLDIVALDGINIEYSEHIYIMLNKPEGYVSATEDGRDPTVLELIQPEECRRGIFPCGRLDKNTLGLMLLTDDGELAHKLLAPKSHVEKTYFFKCKDPLSEEDRVSLESGLRLADGYMTKPAQLKVFDDRKSGEITLYEGKYHQIKRMFGAVNDNRITYLERISFGPLALDVSLKRGSWRYLTSDEISMLKNK